MKCPSCDNTFQNQTLVIGHMVSAHLTENEDTTATAAVSVKINIFFFVPFTIIILIVIILISTPAQESLVPTNMGRGMGMVGSTFTGELGPRKSY